MTDNNNAYEELDALYDEDGNLRVREAETPQEEGSTASLSAVEEIPGDTPHQGPESPEKAGESAVEEAPQIHPQGNDDASSGKFDSGEPEGGATALPLPGDEGYFEDDEEFLRGDARVILSERDGGILENLDDVVTWELDNFYNEAGKQRGRWAMRSDPPVFRIRSSDEYGAEFILTKELAGEMERIMGDVYRGYFGITAKEKGRNKLNQDGLRGYMDKVSSEAKNHPLRFGVLAIFILACLFYLVVG